MALGSGSREFVLKVIADVKDATKGLDDLEGATSKTSDKVKGIAKGIATGVAVGAVVQFGKQAVLSASEAEQSFGAMSSVFGDMSGEMERFGSTSAKNLGISTQEFNQLSAVTGALLKNAGLPMEQVAKSTEDLTSRAADLSAMFGTDVTDSVEAMGSAFKGEFDPLEKYGISLKAADVTARAMAEGYVDASGKVTDAGKAIATQEIIMEQSADAAGTFAKESDTLAGSSQIMTAQMKDAQAQMGQALLPAMVKIMGVITPMVDMFSKYSNILIPIAGIIGGIVLAMKAYEVGQMAVKVATTAWTGVQWLLNAAMAANPLGLIVIAIAAVVAGIVLLYTKVDWFRAFVDSAIDGMVSAWNWLKDAIMGVFNWVKDNWPLLLAIITGPIGIAVKLIVDNWDTIKNAVMGVFNWIKNNWPLLLAIITGPFGLAVLAIQRNWDTIKSGVQTAIDAVRNAVSNVANVISQPFQRGVDLARTAWEGLMTLFRGAWNALNNALSGIANVIKYPFEQAINGIKSLWNNTIGRFSFTVPSWVPGIGGKGWTAPRMAKGGIVNRPTIALIGEAGPEAVVPLGRGGGLGLGTTIINVYALTANAEVGRKVWEALRDYERVSGKQIS
jgi:hypothetical protein